MADGVVNIVFQADDSSTTKAFAALNSEFEGSTTRTVNWTNVQKQNAQAAEFMSQANYKTAASFKPATEAQRAASVAAEDGAKSMGNLATQAGLAYVAYRLLREAAEAVKYVATESANLETADVRFKNLAGNTVAATKAFEGLKTVAKETNTNVVELAAGAQTMIEAGIPMDKIDDVMLATANRARIAGSTVAEMSDIVLRANTRGEVSGRQLAMISKVTGDETGKLSAEYKDMTITIPLLALAAERWQKAMARTREDSERLLSAQTGFLEKTGASKDVFSAFQTAGGQGGSTMVPYVKVPGMENVSGQGQSQVRAVWKELQEGMKQIGKEEHISSQQVSENVRSGAAGFGQDDLMAGSRRFHEAAQIKTSRDAEDYQTQLAQRKEAERLDLAAKATAGITSPLTGGQQGQVANVAATQADAAKRAALEVKDAAQNAGDGLRNLTHWIDGLNKSLTGYDVDAHPIKGMQHEDLVAGRAPKPGGPGFNWETYKPPADGAKTGADHQVEVVKGLTAIVDKLNAIFVAP